MLQQLRQRQASLKLSTRQLATELGVAPSLVSMVLTKRREPSSAFIATVEEWLQVTGQSAHAYAPVMVLEHFLSERSSQLAPLTMKFYEAKLRPFVQWCSSNHVSDVRNVRRAQVATYIGDVRRGRRVLKGGRVNVLSTGALKLHHQTLKTFFKFVGETCNVAPDWTSPLEGIKAKPSQAQTMEYSDEEIAEMFAIVRRFDAPLMRLRSEAILRVLLNSGMRAAELLSVNVVDIREDGRVKVTGKGSKQRVVTVGKTGLDAIDAYLTERGDRTGALWQTYEGERLSQWGLRSFLARIERANPAVFSDGLYAHRFRHTAITRLLRARVPLRSVQRYAGHSNPQTTLRYAQAIDAEDAIQAVDSLMLAAD